MNFGEALTLIKANMKMARAGWNGRGMWIEMQTPDAHSKMTLPYLFLNYPDGRTVPWLASQTDLLENDWMVYVAPASYDCTVTVDLSNQEAQLIKLKKPHWTQTAAGKKIMAKRRTRGSKK